MAPSEPPPFDPSLGQDGGPLWPLKRDATSQEVARDGTPTINPPSHVIRQNGPETVTVTVEASPNDGGGGGGSNLSGGAIAGIVIGSVVGVLLLIWIVRSCFNLGAPPTDREPWYREKPSRHHHHHHRHRSPHYHSHSRSRRSSISAPPPVVVHDYTRDYSRGRRHGRNHY